MNKEQQIEEIEQFIYEYVDSKQREKVYLFSSRVNELAKPFVHNKGIAEALYNAGYRKTFTSDFASDTQKAYKEGYEKGFNSKLTSDFVRFAQKQAVKEFAERLKIKAIKLTTIESYHICEFVDELLKEYEQ